MLYMLCFEYRLSRFAMLWVNQDENQNSFSGERGARFVEEKCSSCVLEFGKGGEEGGDCTAVPVGFLLLSHLPESSHLQL